VRNPENVSIVAIGGVLLIHIPPVGVQVMVVVDPWQIVKPDNVPGVGLTVATAVAVQDPPL
jgi:hypothetical protein